MVFGPSEWMLWALLSFNRLDSILIPQEHQPSNIRGGAGSPLQHHIRNIYKPLDLHSGSGYRRLEQKKHVECTQHICMIKVIYPVGEHQNHPFLHPSLLELRARHPLLRASVLRLRGTCSLGTWEMMEDLFSLRPWMIRNGLGS